MNEPITVGTKLFGVSCHHDIIPFTVTELTVENDGEFTVVKTQLDDNTTEHYKTHYRAYFRELFMFEGVIDKSSVFTAEQDARRYALKSIANKEEELLRKLDQVNRQKIALNSAFKDK